MNKGALQSVLKDRFGTRCSRASCAERLAHFRCSRASCAERSVKTRYSRAGSAKDRLSTRGSRAAVCFDSSACFHRRAFIGVLSYTSSLTCSVFSGVGYEVAKSLASVIIDGCSATAFLKPAFPKARFPRSVRVLMEIPVVMSLETSWVGVGPEGSDEGSVVEGADAGAEVPNGAMGAGAVVGAGAGAGADIYSA